MSEVDKNQKSNPNSDEIDLRELFSAIGNFFNRVFLAVILFVVGIKNAIKDNIKLIVILGIVGGFGGIAFHFFVPKYYESSILLKSTYLNSRLMESSIDKLSLLTEDEDRGALARTLKIDTALANSIKGFRYEPFVSEEEIIELELFKEQLKDEIEDEGMINRFLSQLSAANKSTYRIYVQVYDNSVIPELEEPILDYFRNNPFVQKRLQISEESLKQEYDFITEEEAELDSLKEILFKNFKIMGDRNREGSNNVILADEQVTNPISVFNESRSAYMKKLNIQRELFLQPQFELIDNFTVYSEPASLGLLLLGFFGGLAGLGIAFIIIIVSSFFQFLERIEEKTRKEEKI